MSSMLNRIGCIVVYSLCFMGVGFSLAPLTASAESLFTKTIPLSEVSEIALSGNAVMTVSFGNEQYIKAIGTKGDLGDLQASVDGKKITLKLNKKPRKLDVLKARVRFEVQLGKLERLILMGKSEVFVDTVDAADFTLNVSGGSDVQFKDINADQIQFDISGGISLVADTLTANTFSVDASGSSEITLSSIKTQNVNIDMSGSTGIEISAEGQTDKLDIEVSGSGNFDAPLITATDVKVEINGSSKAVVNATGTLSAEINGSGQVRYYGSPKIDSDISGSGTVRPVKKISQYGMRYAR